ncbi:CE1 family esterase [Roseivivax sp.]
MISLVSRTLASGALLLALLATSATAQDGPIREAIRDRIAERRAERQAGGSPSASGLELITIQHQGSQRSYYIDPATVSAGRGVVMVFHGGEGDGRNAQESALLSRFASSYGFAAVYPNSPGQQWNDGRATTRSSFDDVGYTRAVAADLRARFGLDTGRMFAAGVSNGGMFTQRLACEAPDLFRGYGVVVANMPADLASRCAPGRAQPMIFFQATDDRLMPWQGGEIANIAILGIGTGGRVLSAIETQEFWIRVNNCGGGSGGSVRDDANDGTKAQLITYNCAGGAALRFWVLEGAGHNWPGGTRSGGRIAGNISREVAATDAMLSFFARYGL